LQIIWVDAGYTGELVYGAAYFSGWLLQIIRRCDKGFKVLPRRLGP
jgi:putative transposase